MKQSPRCDRLLPRRFERGTRNVRAGTAAALMVLAASHPDRKRLPVMSFSGITLRLNRDDLTVDVLAAPFQMVTLRIIILLRLVGADRVVRCDCGRIFVRVGKRRTCSVKCQKRVYMRRWRNPPDESEE